MPVLVQACDDDNDKVEEYDNTEIGFIMAGSSSDSYQLCSEASPWPFLMPP